ncbi:MAG: carbon-nitrogen hydrolase family protein, partial [Planctomycetaceae bacterium]
EPTARTQPLKISPMKIAGIQTDVVFRDTSANLAALETAVLSEVRQGTDLTIFPECYASGYCFDSLEEALEFGESIPGPSTDRVAALCRQLRTHVVFGLLERDGDRLYNAAVLIGPDGLIGSYRKVHLPWLGVDRFTTAGERPFEVFEAAGVRIGMLICYDGGFPEASRVLALRGADLILLPTNWPPGGTYMADYAINSRAMENGVYFAAVNRVGTENGFSFIGKSRICHPTGATLATLDTPTAGILRAEIDPQVARTKRVVRVPGKHVIDRMADRRPALYGAVVESHDLLRPGRDEAL